MNRTVLVASVAAGVWIVCGTARAADVDAARLTRDQFEKLPATAVIAEKTTKQDMERRLRHEAQHAVAVHATRTSEAVEYFGWRLVERHALDAGRTSEAVTKNNQQAQQRFAEPLPDANAEKTREIAELRERALALRARAMSPDAGPEERAALNRAAELLLSRTRAVLSR